MENRKKIDDLFKDELGSYTETPPPAVWDALEKKLPSGRSRRPMGWFGYSALLIVLLAISVLVARNISGNTDMAVKDIAANPAAPNTPPSTGDNHGNTTTRDMNAPTNDNQQNGTDQQLVPAGKGANKSTNKNDQYTDKQSVTKNIESKTKNNKTTNEKPADHSSKPYVKFASIPTNGQVGTNVQIAQNVYSDAAGSKTVAVNNAGKEQNNDIQQPQNVYNSAPSNNEAATDDTTVVKNKAKEPVAPKKQPVNELKKTLSKPRPKYKHFEAGIKGGYEFGMDNDASKKAVLSPYLQYKISRKFAIMLQPAIKSASLGSRQIGNPKNYYNVNKDGNITQHTDSVPIAILGTNQTFWMWHYSYTETHDSIIKTNKTGGTYVEFELPVLLKYYVSKEFSVYGGFNIIYSRSMGIREQTYTSRSLSRTVTENGLGPINTPAPPPPEPLSISYTGAPISTYTGPDYPVPSGSLLRFGYMFGFSYEYNKKWLFDGLVQQGMVQPNVQGGYNTNAPLSAPYIRLTIGYKLTK